MDQQNLHLYDDWDIDREYWKLRSALLTAQPGIQCQLIKLAFLNIYLEIKKRSEGKTHFAGRKLA